MKNTENTNTMTKAGFNIEHKISQFTLFVDKELNKNGSVPNVIAYLSDVPDLSQAYIVIDKNHKEFYSKILVFCATHDIIVEATNSPTYEMVLRFPDF